MSRWRAVLVVCCVLLAGCGGPAAVDSPTGSTPAGSPGSPTSTVDAPSSTPTPGTTSPTPAPAPEVSTVEVEGESLPANATAVWDRVKGFRGYGDTTFAPTVEVRPLPDRTNEFSYVSPPEFGQRMGVGTARFDPANVTNPGGMEGMDGSVVVYPVNGSGPEVEAVLAHEYEHLLQPDQVADDPTVDTAITEGGAAYVEAEYADRYLSAVDPVADLRDAYLNASRGGDRYRLAHYYFGYRYVDARIDSPRNLSTVYLDPPETTEELLHGLPPGSEPPASLPVVANGSTGHQWRMGELFLRVSLSTELGESDAAAAAAGWGNDVLVTDDEGAGYVWLVRMDDEADAAELATAFQRFLDEKATRDGDLWRADGDAYRLDRVDEETFALVVGEPGFVRDAAVSGDGETVHVDA